MYRESLAQYQETGCESRATRHTAVFTYVSRPGAHWHAARQTRTAGSTKRSQRYESPPVLRPEGLQAASLATRSLGACHGAKHIGEARIQCSPSRSPSREIRASSAWLSTALRSTFPSPSNMQGCASDLRQTLGEDLAMKACECKQKLSARSASIIRRKRRDKMSSSIRIK